MGVVEKGPKRTKNDSFRHFFGRKYLSGGSNKWILRVFFGKIGKVTPPTIRDTRVGQNMHGKFI